MTQSEIKSKILIYLESQSLMSISTWGKEPWPAIVYFINDKDLNFYFLSDPSSKHCKNIQLEAKVTATIFDSSISIDQLKVGLQISGNAEMVSTIPSLEWMVKMWNKQIAFTGKGKIDLNDVKGKSDSRIYKIKPHTIQFFNKTLVEGESFQTLNFKKLV